MKKIFTNGLSGLGLILLFFIIYSIFNDDTIISFQNRSNYSLLYFFLTYIFLGSIVHFISNKKNK